MTDRQQYMKDYQRRWYAEVVKPRRAKWLLENGPCVDCGSWKDLEVDHEDPSKKVAHSLWTWSEKRRLRELKKCRPRCHKCHALKSYCENVARDIWAAQRNKVVDGRTWCSGHQAMLSVSDFSKDATMTTGYYHMCKACRKKDRKLKHY